MAVEYAQYQLITETIVYTAKQSNSVRQIADMLYGGFCVFISFCVKQVFQHFQAEQHCCVQQWGWKHKKGKAGKENYTAAVDILI